MSASTLPPPLQTIFRPLELDGYRTGALDIQMASRRVLSLPTQLGCRVGCTFCISGSKPFVRNLYADEMLKMVRAAMDGTYQDERLVEVSFTGEGEPILNWKACADVAWRASALFKRLNRVRYCFSGLGGPQLLGSLESAGLPMRLQFSLHAARQELRDRLVPRSAPLVEIKAALQQHAGRFEGVDLNVVLQDGVNDSGEDVQALLAWAEPGWRIVLSPLLTPVGAVEAARCAEVEQALVDAGRRVVRYRAVGRSIAQAGVYPLLAAARR